MLINNLWYDRYSTGKYGKHLKDGITIHFTDMDTGATYYAIWNVVLTRQRTTKNHPKGSRYPGKQFSASKGRKFFKFWHYTCRLPIPSKGLTTFHDCMGKLKDIRFEAEVLEGEKLDKDTIKPFIPDKFPISSRQAPDKSPTVLPDKQLQETDAEKDFEEILTTCESNYGKSKQGKTDIRVPIHTSSTPYEDTNEWLSQCDDLF